MRRKGRPRVEVSLERWDVAFSVGVLALAALAHALTRGTLALEAFAVVYAALVIASRASAARRGRLVFGFLGRPFAREYRPLLASVVVRWAMLATWGLVLWLMIAREELGVRYVSVVVAALSALGIAALVHVVPTSRVLVARNVACLLFVLYFAPQVLLALVGDGEATAVTLDPPVRSAMLVTQGGAGPLVNTHFTDAAQRHAVDVSIASASRDPSGEPVYAPADGDVVRVLRDPRAGHSGEGEHDVLVLAIARDRFLVLADLVRGSVVPRVGERVRCGELLARCGGPGRAASLHLHVQDHPEAFGVEGETYPLAFRNLTPHTPPIGAWLRGGLVRYAVALFGPFEGEPSPGRFVRRNDVTEAVETACR